MVTASSDVPMHCSPNESRFYTKGRKYETARQNEPG
jgi:hypothetical protein